MKFRIIMTVGLLFAAGPLFARLSQQRIAQWVAEDETTWDQPKVDTMLHYIDANWKGNEGTLRIPRKKIIRKWDSEKARRSSLVRPDQSLEIPRVPAQSTMQQMPQAPTPQPAFQAIPVLPQQTPAASGPAPRIAQPLPQRPLRPQAPIAQPIFQPIPVLPQQTPTASGPTARIAQPLPLRPLRPQARIAQPTFQPTPVLPQQSPETTPPVPLPTPRIARPLTPTPQPSETQTPQPNATPEQLERVEELIDLDEAEAHAAALDLLSE